MAGRSARTASVRRTDSASLSTSPPRATRRPDAPTKRWCRACGTTPAPTFRSRMPRRRRSSTTTRRREPSKAGHYDVAIFAWGGAADPDDSAIYSGHNMPPRGQNALFWNDAIATRAMDDELATVDEARRKSAFAVEQRRFASQVPSIVLFYRREPQTYNSDLKGYSASPVISPFWNPHTYSI